MNNFEDYINEVISLKKRKEYDLAWKKANEYMFTLLSEGHSGWYMMYYQMADILAREKRYDEALKNMTFLLHYLGKVGGITHKKFINRLLSKLGKSNLYEEYVSFSTDPEKEIDAKLLSLSKLNYT